MKKLFLVAIFLGGMGLLSAGICQNKAEAFTVEFDVQDLYDWGRTYSYSTPGFAGGLYSPTNLNPYDPGGINNPTVAMVADTAGNADGTEDTWGIAQIDQIVSIPPGTTLFDKSVDPYEITVFFWGFDDDLITSPDGLGKSSIGSVGGHVQIWQDFTPDFDPTLGVANRGPGAADFPTVTEDILLLDLIPVAQNAAGHTLVSGINFNTLVGDGAVFLDSQVGGAWHDIYNNNSQLFGADFFLTFTTRDNTGPTVDSWVIRGDGRGEAFVNPIPEPTTVALLGIGLVGMAGVAVRKKLKKNVVEKS